MAAQTIAQKIEEESLVSSPSEIIDLHLSGAQGDKLDGLTKEFVKLENIDAGGCGLKSLAGLPTLSNLKSIDLSNNNLGNVEALAQCENLEVINLASNEIDNIDSIKQICGLKKLHSLNLKQNKLVKIADYREEIFAMFPSLQYLDDLNKDNEPKIQMNGNGINNGCESEEDEENYESEESDSDEEESGEGIECLQYSEELGEDEEDYAPDQATSEDDDDEIEDEFDNEENRCYEEGEAVNLMKGKKRPHDNDEDVSHVAPKQDKESDD